MISLTLPVLLLILGKIKEIKNKKIVILTCNILGSYYISHINTQSKVTGHVGAAQIEEAIKDSTIG